MNIRLNGLWRHTDFVRLWTAQTISLLGSSVSFLALPLIAASLLHATPLQMGILNTMSTLPALLFGLFAGVWIDRHRRRPIMIVASLGQAAILSIASAAAVLHLLRVEHMYLFALCIALCRLFFDVADQSMLPTLVGREQLVEGNSKLEMSRSGVAVIGPGLAGGLVQLITAPLAILFDAGTFLVSALCIASIRTPEPVASQSRQQPLRHAISDGLRFVLGNPTMRALTGALGSGAFFTSMLDAVLLLYLIRELRLSPGMIGLAFAFGSIGFLVGAMLQSRTVQRLGLHITLLLGLFLTGLGDLMIPTVTGANALPVIVLVLFAAQCCYGIGRTTFSISQISLRQSITPDQMQGRMNATTRMIMAGCTALGGIIGGVLGVAIGLQATLVLAAVGEVFCVVWLLWPRRLFMQLAVVE